MWVLFPVLPVKYYIEIWLKRAGDRIGKMIKVDDTTKATTQGKFARACVEVDLTSPLKAGYRLRGRNGDYRMKVFKSYASYAAITATEMLVANQKEDEPTKGGKRMGDDADGEDGETGLRDRLLLHLHLDHGRSCNAVANER